MIPETVDKEAEAILAEEITLPEMRAASDAASLVTSRETALRMEAEVASMEEDHPLLLTETTTDTEEMRRDPALAVATETTREEKRDPTARIDLPTQSDDHIAPGVFKKKMKDLNS